jgi:hypothetical protein
MKTGCIGLFSGDDLRIKNPDASAACASCDETTDRRSRTCKREQLGTEKWSLGEGSAAARRRPSVFPVGLRKMSTAHLPASTTVIRVIQVTDVYTLEHFPSLKTLVELPLQLAHESGGLVGFLAVLIRAMEPSDHLHKQTHKQTMPKRRFACGPSGLGRRCARAEPRTNRVRGGPHLVHAARGNDAIDEGDGGDEDRENDEDGVRGADLGADAE